MHTIAECPRCKIDFMYHSTDSYLNITTTIALYEEFEEKYLSKAE